MFYLKSEFKAIVPLFLTYHTYLLVSLLALKLNLIKDHLTNLNFLLLQSNHYLIKFIEH